VSPDEIVQFFIAAVTLGDYDGCAAILAELKESDPQLFDEVALAVHEGIRRSANDL